MKYVSTLNIPFQKWEGRVSPWLFLIEFFRFLKNDIEKFVYKKNDKLLCYQCLYTH